MKQKIEEQVALPGEVTASYDTERRVLTVKGPKGELSRRFFNPNITVTINDDAINFSAPRATLREKKILYTFRAHAKNMMRGVSEGFTYKLKICSGHFPMSVTVKGNVLEVKNFIGEKVPRILHLKEGVEVKLEGEYITVSGIDKELVGQVAADIEQVTRRPGFDTRVFQDGIFIIEKDGRKLV